MNTFNEAHTTYVYTRHISWLFHFPLTSTLPADFFPPSPSAEHYSPARFLPIILSFCQRYVDKELPLKAEFERIPSERVQLRTQLLVPELEMRLLSASSSSSFVRIPAHLCTIGASESSACIRVSFTPQRQTSYLLQTYSLCVPAHIY